VITGWGCQKKPSYATERTDLSETFQYRNSWKSVHKYHVSFICTDGRTDRQTYMTKIISAFLSLCILNAPKIETKKEQVGCQVTKPTVDCCVWGLQQETT